MRPVTSDTVMHRLSQHHGAELLRLIGIQRAGVLLATKLPAETIDPDCLWDMGDHVVNLEMESNMRPDMPSRLFEYRARLLRLQEFRSRPLHHHVLVLNSGSPPGQPRSRATTNQVTMSANKQTLFTYHVHLLRNQAPEPLLADPVTAVFAPLARVPDRLRPAVLRRAVEIITASDHPEQRNLIECAGVLASLRINDRTIIDSTITEAAMPLDLSQSPYFRDAVARGRAEGEARGRLRGMLELRFGQPGASVSDDVLARLSLEPDPARLIADAGTLDDLRRQLAS